MREHYLDLAREYIQNRDFDNARKLLNKMPDHPTAQRWLARIDDYEWKQGRGRRRVELPPQLEAIIRFYVANDEIVLWHQQPEPVTFSSYLYPKQGEKGLMILGVVILISQILLFLFVSRDRGPSTSSLMVIAMSLYFILGPFVRESRAQSRAANTHYLLTDRQVLLVEKTNVRRIIPTRIEVVPEETGLDSVVFHRHTGWRGWLKHDNPVGFFGIAGAEEVKRIVSSARRGTSGS